MGVIGWIIFGFVIGLLARAIMPGRDSMGFIKTTVLGIVGALVAGWIGRALGFYNTDSGAGLIAATIGALIVLGIYQAVVRGRRSSAAQSTFMNKDDRARTGGNRDRFVA